MSLIASWLLVAAAAITFAAIYVLIDVAVTHVEWRLAERRAAQGRTLEVTPGRNRLGITTERESR